MQKYSTLLHKAVSNPGQVTAMDIGLHTASHCASTVLEMDFADCVQSFQMQLDRSLLYDDIVNLVLELDLTHEHYAGVSPKKLTAAKMLPPRDALHTNDRSK